MIIKRRATTACDSSGNSVFIREDGHLTIEDNARTLKESGCKVKPKEKKKEGTKVCPKCGVECGYVDDTRTTADGIVHRRRYCAFCKIRWKTVEIREEKWGNANTRKDKTMTARKKVIEYLEKNMISQREFAHMVGMTEVSLSRFISTGRLPRVPYLMNIAKVLNITFDELLLDETDREEIHAAAQKYETIAKRENEEKV